MSKPIKLTPALIESMKEEFANAMSKVKLSDGKVTYTKQFAYQDGDDAVLVFSSMAFAKMTMLVQTFDCEIAWHASCHRDEEEKNWFYVDDIIVYPQEVTGCTVTMDEMKYGIWLQNGLMKDERFEHIHLQGHSHVNMSVNPSATDIDHQEEILRQLRDDSYYIFIIANKKFDYTIRIFDLANNVMYENKEVSIIIGEDMVDLPAFIEEAKEIAPHKTYTASPKGSTTVPVQNSAASRYNGGGSSWGQRQNSGYGGHSAYADEYDYYRHEYYGYDGYRYGGETWI